MIAPETRARLTRDGTSSAAAGSTPASDREVWNWRGMAAAVLICQSAGLLGMMLAGPRRIPAQYERLEKPPFAPPAGVFGPAWGVLYTLMGVALHRLWQRRNRRHAAAALWLFFAQLALNAAWTPVFFALRSLGGGLVIISALLVTVVVATAQSFRVDRATGWLLVPYAAAVAFAATLNGSLARLNAPRGGLPLTERRVRLTRRPLSWRALGDQRRAAPTRVRRVK